MNKHLLSSSGSSSGSRTAAQDRRDPRCPFCTRRNFYARTWSIVLERSSEWDKWTKRRVRFIIGAILFFFITGIALAIIGIFGLFYKENPAGDVFSETQCEIPDFQVETSNFRYDGFRYVSPELCSPGGLLLSSRYCLVECNQTSDLQYTVRTEYESISLRPEYEWNLEGYIKYRRAKWSCNSPRPALTCLRPCDTPSADLIPNANSLASCTNKVHGDSCEVSCQSSYYSVESKIWCNDGDWVVCEDYTVYPDLSKCASLNDMRSGSGSYVSEKIIPVCQRECIISSSDLSTSGYAFNESTSCSNVHACESNSSLQCLSSHQDCYFQCLEQHECLITNTSSNCEAGSAVRVCVCVCVCVRALPLYIHTQIHRYEPDV